MTNFRSRFWERSGLLRTFAFAVLGVFAGLGQAPLDWPIATVSALAMLFWLLHKMPNTFRVWRVMWGFGFGYFAFTLRWIVEPFLVDVETHGWMAPFALILMGLGGGAFWAVAGGIAQRIAPHRAIVLGLLLACAEITRSLVLTGFPWALLGHIWIDTPLAQLAAIGGPHLLTLVTVLAATSLAHLSAKHWDALLVPLGLVGLSFFLDPGPAPDPTAVQKTVRIIQPNVPQNEKWDPAFRDVHFNTLLRFTSAGDVRPHLIVWPETSVPELLERAQPMLDQMSDAAQSVPLIAGVQRQSKSRIYHNSFFLLGAGGIIDGLYDKQHLVPFGEYVPAGELLGNLGLPGMASSQGFGFTAGTLPTTLDIPGIGLARPLICYEGIFAEEVTPDQRPALLILITNDAWFGKSVGPYQHLAQARLRAIEQGLPMVRAANTGVSAMIDRHGRVQAQIALDTAGYIDAPLPKPGNATYYTRFGDIPVFIAIVLMLLTLVGLRSRESD